MIPFFIILSVSVAMLLAVQAMDVECERPRARRRGYSFARKIRMPFHLESRDMVESEAR